MSTHPSLPRVVAPDDRPEIKIGPELPRMVDEAIAALANDPGLYQRAGSLVHVVRTAEPGASSSTPHLTRTASTTIRRPAGVPLIRQVAYPTLRERLSAQARWLRKKEKEWVLVTPPDVVVGAVMSRGEWGGIRPLTAVASSPTVRPDGSILQEKGYDAQTGLLYWPNARYPDVADHPSRDDARHAIAALREVVCDFPFASPEDESAWIAGLLTMLARPAIAGPVPLFAVDATTRGTGKSRLVDAASRIVLGTDAPRTSQTGDDEELRKRITSIMLEGDPLMLIDNVNATLGGASLDTLLTGSVWKDRALGGNATITVPNRVVLWATGNNLALGGDLSRRTLMIRLESPLENPEERDDFKHPQLLRWLAEQRHRLVAIALTVLRAFTAAGSPSQGTKLWGSFEDWSALIPPAIVFAGMPDPLASRATSDASVDSDKLYLTAIMGGLLDMQGEHGITAKQAIELLYPSSRREEVPPDASASFAPMREAIEFVTRAQAGRAPDPVRLGKYFSKVRGRVVGGRRLERIDDPKIIRWRVVSGRKGETT